MSTPERDSRLDMDHLIGEVAAQTGIRLDRNDPAFALVVLNRLVLERSAGRILDGIRGALSDFEKSSAALQAQAGTAVAKELRQSIAALKTEIRDIVAPVRSKAVTRTHVVWLAIGGGAVFGAGVLIGLQLG